MFKSLESVEKLRQEKMKVLDEVYAIKDLDTVYQRQTKLSSMTMTIHTDAANAIMPVLSLDGVDEYVWSSISCRLGKLQFAAIPTASTIREKYRKVVEDSFDGSKEFDVKPAFRSDITPKKHSKFRIKKTSLPGFLIGILVQGVAVPLVLNILGNRFLVLAKISPAINAINTALIIIEILQFFEIPKKIRNRKKADSTQNLVSKGNNKNSASVDYDQLYVEAIENVHKDNRDELNRWFDLLARATYEEIKKELGDNGV